MSEERAVTFTYTNWQGETAVRRVVPNAGGLWYGTTDWHPEPQWFLEAFDLDKLAERTFAVKDIRDWKEAAR